jgi:hypothetical protein
MNGAKKNCTECGLLIPEDRLKARPETNLCVECKDTLEKRPKGSRAEESEPDSRLPPPPLFSAEVGDYVFQTQLPSDSDTEDEVMLVSIWMAESPVRALLLQFTHEEAHKLAELLNKTANLLEQDEVDDGE